MRRSVPTACQEKITAAELAERLLGVSGRRGFGPNLDHLIEELRPATQTGWEGPQLEFKATYMPSAKCPDEDSNQPDYFIWNVIHAFIAFANAHGGCVILGIGENGQNIFPGDWDPDGILTRPKKEEKDLIAHVTKALLKGHISFAHANRTVTYAITEDDVRRLKRLVKLYPCRSEKLDCNAIVAIIHPIPKDGEPISVERTKGDIRQSVIFHRDLTVAKTNEITSLTEIQRYWSDREPAQTSFGEILNRPFKRMPVEDSFFSNIPAPDARFRGREQELTELMSMCAREHVTLIHAAGGTGKTQLAFKYAADHIKDYPGGCFYVPAEHTGSWDEALTELLAPRPSTLGCTAEDWLVINTGMETGKSSNEDKAIADNTPDCGKTPPEKRRTTVDIVNALVRQTREVGKVLIVMDNVERPTRFFTDEKIAQAFPQGIPEGLAIVATSRSTRGIGDGFSNVATMPLGDLTPEQAVSVLNLGLPLLDEEREAAAEIVRLLGYRALYVRRVTRIVHSRSKKSYNRVLKDLRRDKLPLVQPGEDEEDTRAPGVIWCWTQKELKRADTGAKDIRLAQAIALFPADGVADRILEALWYADFGNAGVEDMISAYKDDPDLFYDALNRLAEYSLIQYNPQEHIVRMHRLDRAIIQKQLGESDASFLPHIGKALKANPCVEADDWLDWAKGFSDLAEFCPIATLDAHNAARILTYRPSLASDDVPWPGMTFGDWWNLLLRQPQFVDKANEFHIPITALLARYDENLFADTLNRDDFCGAIWARILCERPELTEQCPTDRLSKDDWLHLLSCKPELLSYCRHPEILTVPSHPHATRRDTVNSVWDRSEWGTCLAYQPDLENKCNWETLSHDDIISILNEAPGFADRIPERSLATVSGYEWTDVVKKHVELIRFYPDNEFPRKHRGKNHPYLAIDEEYGFPDDNGLDWSNVYKSHPEIVAHCPFDRLSALQWCKLLLADPSLAKYSPPWDQIGPLAQTRAKDFFYRETNPFAALLALDELAEYRNDVYQEYLAKQGSAKTEDDAPSKVKNRQRGKITLKDVADGVLKPPAAPFTPGGHPYDGYDLKYLIDMPCGLDFSYVMKEPMPISDGKYELWEFDEDRLSDVDNWMINVSHHTDVIASINLGQRTGAIAKLNCTTTAAVLICIYPQLADLFDWAEFSGRELCLIMLNRPSMRSRCNWDRLTGRDWAVLLSRNPEFVDVCDWGKFTPEDRQYLRDERPWLVPSDGT